MGLKTDTLIALLGQAAAELRGSGDAFHAGEVEACRDLLQKSDLRGIRRTLSVFDAKSTLNDVQPRRLGPLSHRIWELADAIRREVERSSRKR